MEHPTMFTVALALIVGLACGVLMHQFVTDAFTPRPYRQPWWRR